MTGNDEPLSDRREVEFAGHHPAFSAAFEPLLRRTDAHLSDHVATFTVEAGASGPIRASRAVAAVSAGWPGGAR